MRRVNADRVLVDWLRRHGPAAAFLRDAQDDADARPGADLDLLVFDDAAEEFWVERQALPGGRTLDLLRLPAALLDDPARLAAMGLVTHRLLSAVPVGDTGGRATRAQAQVRARWRAPAAVAPRLAAFLEMGWLTVREVGVTADWPSLARFWLHMAQAAAIAVQADAAGLLCPNVYTRPLHWLRHLEPAAVPAVVQRLGLDRTDPAAAAQALRELHAEVTTRCPEPPWPAAMREVTRREWRYWSAPAELAERLEAAAALPAPDAVFYLRYTAYSLLRVAMLHQRALDGWPRHIPFIRPEVELRPDLERHHPTLLPLAEAVFGRPTAEDLAVALEGTQALQRRVLDRLEAAGHPVPDRRPWQPHHRGDAGVQA